MNETNDNQEVRKALLQIADLQNKLVASSDNTAIELADDLWNSILVEYFGKIDLFPDEVSVGSEDFYIKRDTDKEGRDLFWLYSRNAQGVWKARVDVSTWNEANLEPADMTEFIDSRDYEWERVGE